MTGTVEFIQRIRYAEIPDEKGEMQAYAIPETVEALVRCKDCKRATDYTDEMTDCPYHCRKYGGFHSGDWYCAGGERKEGR